LGCEGWNDILTEQVRSHSRWLFTAAYRIVRDPQMAEDVCQTALAKAWEKRQDIDHPRALNAWLTRVVVNESLSVLRRRQIEARVLAAQRQAAAMSDDSPLERMGRRDEVAQALEQLPEAVRMVVVLRTMQGLTGKQTAAQLQCSQSDVSRKLHEGMEQLRRMLK
jgi:RNA polymerase sigma-70 factor (ECF subfamily)